MVACQGGGAAEVVIPKENGILVPPDDVDALVRELRSMLSDPEAREAMGVCGRRYVAQTADSEVCLKRLETFYADVIASIANNRQPFLQIA